MFKNWVTYLDNLEDNRQGRGALFRMLTWLLARPAKLVLYLIRGLMQHGTMVRSAALTYYTLVSIVPVVALVFAIVKGFGLADGLVQNLYSIFPQIPDIVDYVVEFAQKTLARTQGGWVAAFSLAALFWSVVSVFSSIEDAFNNIWEVSSNRSLIRKYSDYIAIIVIAPLMWVVASSTSNYLHNWLNVGDTFWVRFFSKIISMAMAWVMFSIIYIVLPNTKVRYPSAIKSGIIAGTVFIVFQWLYVSLQLWMTSYNAIYGSFAALPLFLIWVQASWSILLLGAELSFTFQNEKRFDEERETMMISYDSRRKVMIAIMVVVARAFREGKGAIDADQIRNELNLPARIMSNALHTLVSSSMLNQVHRPEQEYDVAYAPARDINSLRVYDILQAVDNYGYGEQNLDLSQPTEMAKCCKALDLLKDITDKSIYNKKITEFFDNKQDEQ